MTKVLSPKNANTFEKVCSLKRDNLSAGNSWILVEENSVSIGVRFGNSIRIPKKAFEKLVRFYTDPQTLD